MDILIINPNTSIDFTNRIDFIAKSYANPRTNVKTLNPQTGPGSIEGMYDAMLSAPGILDIFLRNHSKFDAFVMASYGDHPMISALREITHKPVIGIAEASMQVACQLGYRFSIVTSGARWVPLLEESVVKYGLSDRCSSIRSIHLPVWELESGSQIDVIQEITNVAMLAIKEDKADVICLGSGGMARFHKLIEEKLCVPVVDGVIAGLKMAESIVQMGLSTSKQSLYATPKKRPLQRLPEDYSSPNDNQEPGIAILK